MEIIQCYPARVVELLLVHDIPEIDAGDQIVYAVSDGVQENERAAAERIFGLLPEQQGERLLLLWNEFTLRQTAEARFAYAMDRLMPVLHNIYNNGQSWQENHIPLEKVLSVNSVIGDACPAMKIINMLVILSILQCVNNPLFTI